MVTFVVKSPSGVVLHEWDVTRWGAITAEEHALILGEIIALGGVRDTRELRIWLGLRILDLVGAAARYTTSVKISAEIASVNPDPGADTQAIPRQGGG